MTPNPVVKIFNIKDRRKDRYGTPNGLRTKSPYQLRWEVAGKRHSRTLPTKAYAEKLRVDLFNALTDGVAFDRETGEPVSWDRSGMISFAELARKYMLHEWAEWRPSSRKAAMEALQRAVPLFVRAKAPTVPSGMGDYLKRHVLRPAPLGDPVPACASWIEKYSLPVDQITDELAANVLKTLSRRLDGRPAARSTVNRYRISVGACFGHGVHPLKLVTASPWPRAKQGRRKKKASEQAPAAPVNPALLPDEQLGRALLAALPNHQPGSLVNYAILGSTFVCGLRPSEVFGLDEPDVELPDAGWGWFHLRGARPGGIGNEYFDSPDEAFGPLKATSTQESKGRSVPIPPWWVAQVRWVLEQRPPLNGVLFVTANGTSPTPTNLRRAWEIAKHKVLPAMVAARPGSNAMIANPLLLTTHYDLRHARASIWLQLVGKSGMTIPQIAKWLGHSPEVLMATYANCVVGDESAALAALDEAEVAFSELVQPPCNETSEPFAATEAEVA